MKRCSQCEFIYEDDQSLCDMDGADLVYDPTPFPLAKIAAPHSPVALPGSQWWRVAATAVVGMVLGTLLFLVYHVSTQPTPDHFSTTASQSKAYSSAPVASDPQSQADVNLAQPAPLDPPVEAQPAAAPMASPESSQSPAFTQPSEPGNPNATATSDESAFLKGSATPSRSSTPKTAERKRRPARANLTKDAHQKKDSTIGSFLKKTGHILKKPFKF